MSGGASDIETMFAQGNHPLIGGGFGVAVVESLADIFLSESAEGYFFGFLVCYWEKLNFLDKNKTLLYFLGDDRPHCFT